MGQEHTTRPSNREAAVRLSRHFVQRATRPWIQPSTRSSEPSQNKCKKVATFQSTMEQDAHDEVKYRQILWLGIKRRWISKQSSPGYQSRLHAADRTPLNGACC
ncbi:unnamed protein product [Triticum turgidum subsp. durum]|uniref:Uncharacterized protein n=1 Tax=Triticum turgidum subsp. durum TaxID=4567 RepID=A0A9R0YJN5_TRITD|nr:unnamed protein product [Triticum turgidum subsp. durum]